MRKAMILYAVLVAVAIGGMCWAHAALTTAQDDVSLTEIAAYGDASAADGLTVLTHAQLARHLLWNTAYTFGQTPQTHTDSLFSVPLLSWQEDNTHRQVFELYTALEASGSGSGDMLDNQAFDSVAEMLHDVASRTRNGVRRSENLNIRDYYDYYPISVDVYGYYFVGNGDNGQSVYQPGNNAEVREAFTNYFQLAVLETDIMTVDIQKDNNGNAVEIRTALKDSVSLSAVSFATESGIYFALNTNGITDFSNTPGGFGIYMLPASTMRDNNGKPITTLEYQRLQTVYPLNMSVYIQSLQLSEDGRCINLITKEDGGLYLTVIEIATMTEKQKLPLFAAMEDASVRMLNMVDGLLFVLLDDDRFMLAEQREDSTYEPMLADIRVDKLETGPYGSWDSPEVA